MTTIHQTEGILVIKGAVEVLLDKIDEHQKPLSAFERKAKRSSQRRLSGYCYAIKEMRALLDP
jgi:hypothetical protein